MLERVSGLSKSNFYDRYVRKSRPVIITDLTGDWPAMSGWSADYFMTAFGSARVGTMTIKEEKCDVDTYNESETGKDNIGNILKEISLTDRRKVIASPIEDFPPAIRDDFKFPHYCEGGSFVRSRLYMGPAGLVTSLHQDLPENLYVLVRGSKKITLYPPSDRRYLYINSMFSRHPNFAHVDPLHPDFTTFPKFKSASPETIEMRAGETLFIPSFWWHHLRNEEDSIAMNFWWSYDWKAAIAWAAAMYKKWMR